MSVWLDSMTRLMKKGGKDQKVSAIAFLIGKVWRYRKKVICKQISYLNKPFDIDRYYSYVARLVVETSAGGHYDDHKVEFTNNALNLLKSLEGKKVAVLMAHYGNWEISLAPFPQIHKDKVYVIYKPLNNKSIDKWLKKIRTRTGAILTPMAAVYRQILKEQSGLFFFINDQSPPRASNQGRWIHFLGRPTFWQNGIEKISQKVDNLTFVYLDCIVKSDHYIVDLLLLDHNDPLKDYVTKLETSIERDPVYWLWSHNRWKHPKGTSI